jgi:lactate permease
LPITPPEELAAAISTGASTTALKGQEGRILARTFGHSIVLTVLLGLLVATQQHLFPWMIPG